MALAKIDPKDPGIERAKVTLIGFDSEDVRYEAVKKIAELLDVSFDEATELAESAPVDILPSAPVEAAELLAEKLSAAGCIAEALPLGQVYRYCDTHPHRRARARCKTCEINICEMCLRNSKGRFYCPEHYEIFKQKRTLRLVGVALAVVAGLFVAAFFSAPLIRMWKFYISSFDTHVAVIYVSQKPNEAQSTFFTKNMMRSPTEPGYQTGDAHTIADLADWFNKEYQRITADSDSPFELTSYGFYTIKIGPPPAAPAGDKSYKGLEMKAAYWGYFKDLIEQSNLTDRLDADVVLLVELVDDTGHDRDFIEDLGSAQFGYAYVQIPVSNLKWSNDYYVAAAAHYMARAMGASLKLTAKGFPKNPEGLASPQQQPPFPQPQAEIAAGYRSVEEFTIERPSTLDDYVVGPLTGYEFGWVSANLVQGIYPNIAVQ